MNKVITIIGPTASGKTKACLKLVDFVPIEVISADSRQIYRYMDIGTGKPTPEERKKVTHHLIDIIDPDEKYSAAKFTEDCIEKVNEIESKNKIPVICGGTILYIKAILEGLFPEPYIPKDIREKVRKQLQKDGVEKMYEELLKADPELGAQIHPNDKQRIARALEVYRASGIPLSKHWEKDRKNKLPLNIHCILPSRKVLYENIKERIYYMFNLGFIDEVENLLDMNYKPSLYSFTSIGYKEIAFYLLNGKNRNIHEIESEIIKKTKEYSKRQITFIKNLKNVHFYETVESLREGILEEI
jgi:tRNA dimethylallyltransferase